MGFTIGCDPEIFVKNIHGDFFCPYELIPGTKIRPHKVRNGQVQVDGMALEFGIDPVDSEEEFIHNISDVMKQLSDMLPDNLLYTEDTSIIFDSHTFSQYPRSATAIGCDPELSAYEEFVIPPDESMTMRAAGGHIHVGWTEHKNKYDPDHLKDCKDLTKQLDYYLGAPSILMEPKNDRRLMYGQAGRFRVKPYGLEYRVLGNYWIMSEELIRNTFRNLTKGLNAMISKNFAFQSEDLPDVRDCIDNSRKDLAESIVKALDLEVVK